LDKYYTKKTMSMLGHERSIFKEKKNYNRLIPCAFQEVLNLAGGNPGQVASGPTARTSGSK
jgi:hypothetical protein